MKSKLQITPLYASATGKPGTQWKPGTELPKSLLVLAAGDNPSTKGTFKVTDLTAKMFERVQHDRGRDRVTIDFEHNTLAGTPAYNESKEPRVTAGRGVAKVTALGVEVTDIEWTPEGRKMARHYGDLSPAPVHLADGTVVGLDSVALVRNGAIYDLTFCSAGGEAELPTHKEEEDPMLKTMLTALTAAKLIPENATEQDAVTFITGLGVRLATAEAAMKTMVAETVVTALTAEVQTLMDHAVQIQKDHLLDLARYEGKVVALTADVVKGLSLEQLREQIAKITPTIPLAQRTIVTPAGADAGKGKDAAGAVTDVQRQVAKDCAVDPAKVSWAK